MSSKSAAQRSSPTKRSDNRQRPQPIQRQALGGGTPNPAEMQKRLGNQGTQAWLAEQRIQPKLTIGQPGDQYEQEADRTADKVMRMPDPGPPGDEETKGQATSQPNELQLKSDVRVTTEAPLMAKSESGQLQASSDLQQKLNTSKSSGRTLPKDTRSSLESAMGADFSNVNIHTGTDAVEMNKELGAQAFTHGSDIYFNQGKYDPTSSSGKHLLAHELTHTMQQGASLSTKQNSSSAKESVSQASPKIQRSVIDDLASYLLTGNAVLDFTVGVVAGIFEWFGDLISGVISLFNQALEGSIGAILAIAGIIIVIILACVFPEVVIPILIGIGIVMGLISMLYFLYMMTRPGLTPYERGKYLGKAIVEAALMIFTVAEAARLLKTFAEVAKLAEGFGLIQKLKWVRQLLRFGETAKVLEILAEIGDIEKTIDFLTLVNDVNKAQDLLRLTRNAGEIDILLDLLRIEGLTADDLLEFMRFAGMTLPDLSDILRTTGMTPDMLRELFLLNGMTAGKLKLLLGINGMTVQELTGLLSRQGMTVDTLIEILGKPGMTITELKDLLGRPGMVAGDLKDLLNIPNMTVLQLKKLLDITDSVTQLKGFLTRIDDPVELERLINNAGLDRAPNPEALRLERTLNQLGPGRHSIAQIEQELAAQKEIDSKILTGRTAAPVTPGVAPTGEARRIIGAHSPRILTDPDFRILSQTTNADGTITVRFQKVVQAASPGPPPVAEVLSQKKTSTVAPPSWTDNDILRAGDLTGSQPAIQSRVTDRATLHIHQVNGVEWAVIKDGRITSSFPTGGQPVPF